MPQEQPIAYFANTTTLRYVFNTNEMGPCIGFLLIEIAGVVESGAKKGPRITHSIKKF